MHGYIAWTQRYLRWAVVLWTVLWLVLFLWFMGLGSGETQFQSPSFAVFLATLGSVGLCIIVGLLWLIGLAIAYWGDVQR